MKNKLASAAQEGAKMRGREKGEETREQRRGSPREMREFKDVRKILECLEDSSMFRKY